MKKRMLSILLALVMVLGMLPVTALAETSGIWEYYTNYNSALPGGMEVTIYGCNGSGSVTVPSTIAGYYVTGVSNSTFYNNEKVTSITFSSNSYLEFVGDFMGCTNLKSVNMSGITLKELPDSMFCNCSSLTSFSWPKGVTKIGEDAFYGCDSLTSLTIPSTVTSIADSDTQYYGVFAYCTSLKTNDMSKCKITKVPTWAFHKCSALTTVKLPSTLKTIGSRAFNACTALQSITLPDTVTSIDSYAFSGCTGLTALTLPTGLTSLGECALQSCSKIEAIHLPKDFSSFGTNAFDQMSRLGTITVDSTNRYFTVVDNVLYNKSMTKLVCYPLGKAYVSAFYIPVGVTTIGKYAFSTS